MMNVPSAFIAALVFAVTVTLMFNAAVTYSAVEATYLIIGVSWL